MLVVDGASDKIGLLLRLFMDYRVKNACNSRQVELRNAKVICLDNEQ